MLGLRFLAARPAQHLPQPFLGPLDALVIDRHSRLDLEVIFLELVERLALRHFLYVLDEHIMQDRNFTHRVDQGHAVRPALG